MGKTCSNTAQLRDFAPKPYAFSALERIHPKRMPDEMFTDG